MKVLPSVEGLRHLRGQGWTYERIATEYGVDQGEVYWMLQSGPVFGPPKEFGRVPAIGYVRVNSPQALTESLRQRKNIAAWAKRTGHLMVGWVEDIWEPGTGGNDVGTEELVARVRSGEASVVAVEEMYRISRQLDVFEQWAARVEAAGGRVESTGSSSE